VLDEIQGLKSMDASPFDVYLQPHSDDICFSLGAFAHKHHCGILLTVLPISAFMPNPGAALHSSTPPESPSPSSEWITNSRKNEDIAFAAACKLKCSFLEMPCASFLGHAPFDLAWINQNQRRIAAPLLDALVMAAADRPSRTRPWLFCPTGIGSHVDHVAIHRLINENFNLLSQYYRLGFYEDLHYASDAAARSKGIGILQEEMRYRGLRRHAFPFGERVAQKLSLIKIYSSQFPSFPQSIQQFTPAADVPHEPHEAIWSCERMPIE